MQNKKITFGMVMLALLKTIGRAALWAAVVAYADSQKNTKNKPGILSPVFFCPKTTDVNARKLAF